LLALLHQPYQLVQSGKILLTHVQGASCNIEMMMITKIIQNFSLATCHIWAWRDCTCCFMEKKDRPKFRRPAYWQNSRLQLAKRRGSNSQNHTGGKVHLHDIFLVSAGLAKRTHPSFRCKTSNILIPASNLPTCSI
jgi:hypothetical protein